MVVEVEQFLSSTSELISIFSDSLIESLFLQQINLPFVPLIISLRLKI